MIFIVVIAVISVSVCIFLFSVNGIKYQIKLYTKLYSRLLESGKSNNDAILYLVIFYSRGEPIWKCQYVKGRLKEYYNSFDQFILDLTLFHYSIHPWQQDWQTDVLNNRIAIDKIMNQVEKYLIYYKAKYLKNSYIKTINTNYEHSSFNFEIKENINHLKGKIYEIESIFERSRLNNQIHCLKEELNIIDGIIKKQNIRSQFI